MSTEAGLTRCSVCGQSFAVTVKLCPNDGSVLEHTEASDTHIGEVLDGKYRLDSFLSRGGMGAVYKATHVMLGRTVAVKLINAEFLTSTEASRRFQREARAATTLNHSNIVSVYDLGQTPKGTLYIAMEFVDGQSLKSVIAAGPLTPARTISILRQVASALAVAHRNSIVHRDLKPQNIMLTRGNEMVKLVDFGIAKTFDSDVTQLTMSGATLGTPHYMSPEQAAGEAVDGRSDLYSLGVVLYEMLSGDVPFNDKSATAIIIKHMKEAPQPPSLRNPGAGIPPALEAATLRCLEKDPARRFQTVEELIGALDEAGNAIAGVTPAATVSLASEQPTIRNVERPTPSAKAVVPAAAADTRPTAVPPPTRSTAVRAASTPVAAPDAPKPSAAPLAGNNLVAKRASNKAAIGILAAVLVLVVLGTTLFLFQRRGTLVESQAAVPTGAPATAMPDTPQSASAAPAPATPDPPQSASVAAPQTASASVPAVAGASTIPTAVPAAAPAPPTQATPPAAAIRGSVSDRAASGRGSPAPTASAQPSAAGVSARADGIGSAAQAAPGRGADDSPRQAAAPALFPESPAIYFHCSGAMEICGALRSAVEEALAGASLTSVRTAARADIDVAATVEGLQQTVSQQFQTTFAVRTYSIEVSAEATRTSEAVPMPPPSNLSFDPQFGSARATERSRLVAADIVERVKAFVEKKRGG